MQGQQACCKWYVRCYSMCTRLSLVSPLTSCNGSTRCHSRHGDPSPCNPTVVTSNTALWQARERKSGRSYKQYRNTPDGNEKLSSLQQSTDDIDGSLSVSLRQRQSDRLCQWASLRRLKLNRTIFCGNWQEICSGPGSLPAPSLERERERERLFERETEHLWLRQLTHGIGGRDPPLARE